MLPFAIFAALGLTMFMMGGDDASDDTSDDPTPESEDQATIVPVDDLYDDSDEDDTDDEDPILIDPETGAYLVGPGQTAIGTDGDDLFTLVEGAEYSYSPYRESVITISAGDGDDSILLNAGAASSIDGGAGDDIVRSQGWAGHIDGGDGDDDIQVSSMGGGIEGGAGNDLIFNINGVGPTYLYGGDGDDHLIGQVVGTDKSDLFGGAGNDIVDGRDMDNANLYGGAGDDIIYTALHGSQGAGYSVFAYGGDGDDRFIHNDAPPDSRYQDTVPRLLGGDGSDNFEISFSEVNNDNTVVSRSSVVGILDFENGVDAIQINAMVDNPDVYSVVSAELQEDTENSTTRLVVSYEAAPDPLDPESSLPDREMVVTIVATDVTWDDITFVGDNVPPVLVPV
ncbi:MAG: Ca2+-binding RTX toxin-like protein [Yoonia sp.]|jgi:Ca2+-binding RTX toxin-like protein